MPKCFSDERRWVILLFSLSSQARVKKAVDGFLRESGLLNRSFTIEELIAGARKAGLNVVAESFTATEMLRGVLVDCGDIKVIFYPDGDTVLGLHTVAHELGHLVLNHQWTTKEATSHAMIYGDDQEQEAELFGRMLVQQSHVAAAAKRPEAKLPQGVVGLFRSLQR